MRLSKLVTLSLGLASIVTADNATANCCSANTTYATGEYQNDILDIYLALWNGNYSLLNDTFSPEIKLIQNRLPIGVFNVSDRAQYQAWIEHSRYGWDQFKLVKRYWFASGYKIGLRWYLDGIIGNVSAHAPGSTIPSGSYITYNGTDVLSINPCTGLIDVVESAQDFLTYFYNLGLRTIST